jgi:hypothetical protein
MRQVDIELKGWMIADAMAELRIWLDHNNCVPWASIFQSSRAAASG